MAWKNEQVSEGETEFIRKVATECLSVAGDFVEMGCYKGDTSLMLAEILRANEANCAKNDGEKSKKLYIYDSFEGLPEKREEDNSVLGEEFKKGELGVTKREVKERFLRAGLKVPVMKKGWFSELSVGDMPEKIAFSFLDGDFYESIKDSLKLVENLMVPGGIILVHDYNNPALPGVKKAVEEWKTDKNIVIDVFESIAVIKYKKIV